MSEQTAPQKARIWVDADACPNIIKDVLFKAARRTGIELIFVANQAIKTIPAPNIRAVQVAQGFDVADNYIVQHSHAGDIVITGDIPLADELISKQVHILNTRGDVLDKNNIKARLNMRDFMETMRDSLEASGQRRGGPPPLEAKDKQQFANSLDRWLAKNQ